MAEVRLEQKSLKDFLRKNLPRIAKATVVTVIIGIILLVFWLVVSAILAPFPKYLNLFAVLVWTAIFFTFAIRVTVGTIYKYFFIIARALFLIFFTAYSTDYGVLSLDYMNYHFTVEFIPLLALMIMISILEIVKGTLQIIQFTSDSPYD